MRDYAAEMDRILAEYSASSRSVQQQFFDVDAQTTREGAQLTEELRHNLRREPETEPSSEELAEQQARADSERLLHEVAEREAARDRSQPHGRHDDVLPSDWTELDQARAEGYGPPDSWLS